jgi:hypothetical protein
MVICFHSRGFQTNALLVVFERLLRRPAPVAGVVACRLAMVALLVEDIGEYLKGEWKVKWKYVQLVQVQSKYAVTTVLLLFVFTRLL